MIRAHVLICGGTGCTSSGSALIQKSFEENNIKQQTVIRKHEAEINVLKEEAEQAHEAIQKVDQLEAIVKNITEGGVKE